MEYRKLGSSGLKVSTLCLGTMALGEADETSFMHKLGCDEKTAFGIMDRCLDAGVNFFDTADVYGQEGMVEKLLGRWFSQSQKRDDVVLATKFRFRMSPNVNGTGASRLHIMRAVEASLKRLQTDRIELYQIHMQDIDTPEDETLRALDDLVTQGKILYVGASNYAAYRLVESLYTSDKHGWSKFVSLQAHYNLVTRSLEREHVPACLRFGLGILPWSPLAAGFLTGKYQRGQPAPEKTRLASKASRFFDYSSDRNWGVVEELVKIAAELEKTPAQVALAWLVQRPAVTSVIFGARSLEQLEANLSAATLVLDDQTMKRLNDVSAPHLDYPYDFLNRVQGRW